MKLCGGLYVKRQGLEVTSFSNNRASTASETRSNRRTEARAGSLPLSRSRTRQHSALTPVPRPILGVVMTFRGRSFVSEQPHGPAADKIAGVMGPPDRQRVAGRGWHQRVAPEAAHSASSNVRLSATPGRCGLAARARR